MCDCRQRIERATGPWLQPNKDAISPSKFALKTENQLLDPPRFQPASGERRTQPCNGESFRVSSAPSKAVVMNSKPILSRPWMLGLMITLLQIFVAVVLIAPEGPLS